MSEVPVRRRFGWGPCYMPRDKRIIKEGEDYSLPEDEAWAREDWDVLDEKGQVVDRKAPSSIY